ncbi:MAG: hypothetical protein ABR575_02635 [Actinomycetota bacterium]
MSEEALPSHGDDYVFIRRRIMVLARPHAGGNEKGSGRPPGRGR